MEHRLVDASDYGGVRAIARPYISRLGLRLDAEPVGEVWAEVDHGRWIARCPCCPGAELVQADDPVFWCLSCGAGPYQVRFPQERQAIEEWLLSLPRERRYWRPQEIAQ